MSVSTPTKRRQLPGETLPAKAAQLTVGGCLFVVGAMFVLSAYDEVTCVAGEYTSVGDVCGARIQGAGVIFLIAVLTLVMGAIIFTRGLRRPIEPNGDTGWRTGQSVLVFISGVAIGVMIPRYSCPSGMRLTPFFRWCVTTQRAFPAPSPGLPWKYAAPVVGAVLAILVIRWRTMPWQLASAIVVTATLAAAIYTLHRSVGLPW